MSGEEAEAEGDADGSYSSRMSNKSEKNMADFDGEDSVCEEELAQLAEHVSVYNFCLILAIYGRIKCISKLIIKYFKVYSSEKMSIYIFLSFCK